MFGAVLWRRGRCDNTGCSSDLPGDRDDSAEEVEIPQAANLARPGYSWDRREPAAVAYWPPDHDEASWARLTTSALQLATLAADIAENRAWTDAMEALVGRQLGYKEFAAARHDMLDERLRQRKLLQQRLRYRFGFRQASTPRNDRLVRAAVIDTLTPMFAEAD